MLLPLVPGFNQLQDVCHCHQGALNNQSTLKFHLMSQTEHSMAKYWSKTRSLASPFLLLTEAAKGDLCILYCTPKVLMNKMRLQNDSVRKCQSNFNPLFSPPLFVAALRCSFLRCDHILFSSHGAPASFSYWAVAEYFFLSPHSGSGLRPYSSNSIQTPQLLASSWAFRACSLSYISQAFMDSSLPLFPPW